LQVFSEEVGNILRGVGILPVTGMVESERVAIWGMVLSGLEGLILPTLLFAAYRLCICFFSEKWRLFLNGAFILFAYLSMVFLFCYLFTCQNTLEFYYPKAEIDTWSAFLEIGYFWLTGFVFAFLTRPVLKLVGKMAGEELVEEKKKEDSD
jgi:hypothetical protein